MSQSIHNDGNWQRVDTGEWVPKAEHDNLRFALTDALVREDAFRAQVERLTAPVSDEEWARFRTVAKLEQGFSPDEFIYRDEVTDLIAARASQQQTYESALRAGMRQNYAQEADRAVDRLLDEKERI